MPDLLEDEHWMRICLALAERGVGRVSPNPLVGCVIVRNGKKVAEGWHRAFGGPHAEREALKWAGPAAKGATAYINLEPCCHWGKTPPCTDALIAAGVRRVVAAVRDPNRLMSGRGLARLRRAGISVTVGVLEKDAAHLNRAFFKWIRTGLPYVTLKAAATLDGKICTRTGASRWISSPASRRWVHRLRGQVDAVAVGANTALRDNPLLTAHGEGRNPIRILIDGRLAVKPSARVFSKDASTILATTLPAARKAGRLRKKGVALIACRPERAGRGVNLKELMRTLGKMYISHVLVEGGGSLNASFIENRLVDEMLVFVAPKVFGGEAARTVVEGEGVSSPGQAWNLRWDYSLRVGPDLLLRAVPA